MLAAMDLAGYTASEADDLRKAISKKNEECHRPNIKIKFIAGAQKNGIDEETATRHL